MRPARGWVWDSSELLGHYNEIRCSTAAQRRYGRLVIIGIHYKNYNLHSA